MLRGAFEAAGELDPGELRAAYDDLLATTVESVGVPTVAAESGIDEPRLRDLIEGASPGLSLSEATAILATAEDRPDAETLAVEARDILLMGMTTAVLDVEALASEIDGALDPKEIQQKIEGRHPMTLDEYALLHSHIEGRKP